MKTCLSALAVTAVLLASCSTEPIEAPKQEGWTDPITGIRLVVKGVDKHPFLRDHDRALFVVSPSGEVSRAPLAADTGVGAHSNLYRQDENELVLVDINGVWISILASGEIESRLWRWDRELPEDYLGTFQADDHLLYHLVDDPEPKIYLYKDPPDDVESSF